MYQNVIKAVYFTILISILVLPSVGLFVDFEEVNACEKRSLEEMPTFEFSKEYFTEFEVYFKENFTFRNRINNLSSTIKKTIFNSSSKPTKVVNGKDGWFFYTSVADKEIGSFSRNNLLTEEQLIKKNTEWEGRKKVYIQRGVAYYRAVWPNKSTIYSEMLPFTLAVQQMDTLSKIDQVLQFFEMQKSQVNIIDVRKELFVNKQDILYLKHDTHWNELGAFYAYQKLISEMGMTPYQLNDFEITWEEVSSGDLIPMMGLCNNQNIKEKKPIFKFKDHSYVSEEGKTELDRMYYIKNNTMSNKRILVFRDSYTSAMVQFISLHFKEAYFVWSGYKYSTVKLVKPDVILEASVERYF